MPVTVNGLHMTQHKLIHAKKGGSSLYLASLKKQLKIKTHEGRRKTDKTYLAPLQYLQYLREPSTVN